MGRHRRRHRGGGVFIAEDDGGADRRRLASRRRARRCAHPARPRPPASRRQGVAKALLGRARTTRRRGAAHVTLEVLAANEPARGSLAPARLRDGLATAWRRRSTRSRRGCGECRVGPARATTHVQTDDEVSVERAVAQFVPRLEAPQVSAPRTAGSASPTRCSTTTATRTAASRRSCLRAARRGHRRARDEEGEVVRFRLYERGRMVDEYLSVPDLLRRAAEGRRARARGEPDARVASYGRRPRRGAARDPHGAQRRPTCRPEQLYEQIARADGARGGEAHRRAALPVLRARADRARGERRSSTRPSRSTSRDRPQWLYELNAVRAGCPCSTTASSCPSPR